MKIAGIDFSMTCPAICVHDTNSTLNFQNLHLYALSSGAKKHLGVRGNIRIDAPIEFTCPEERYKALAGWALSILLEHGVEKVYLEGYSMGSSVGLVFNIAENTSVLKQMLYAHGIPFETPPPSQVKKAFTGKGNAKKPEMCEEFYKRFGVKPYEIIGCPIGKTPENDLVDATANMLMHHQKKE